ncbi:membrane protein [Haematobacter missouriensis]|uniref:Probable membrane transporter protein n=1 Tax=Haematobacter missouriensis TaxID=366616 RepID=A0A212ALL1_9RHOB|nr:sulfite exporter TauE/SafE family protein [Haematobacter missouriensis]KFI32437.1 membrane protein [Haematobacter missouriensis]OWJ76493.1 anion permease [Haematobacter missouriensis]OWJ82236.1 anion permease [Haematobacter missouriensis]
MDSLPLIFALTFLAAGFVKGVTGMGLPTVAMGVLGTLIPPVAAAGLLIVPSFVTNVLQFFSGPYPRRTALRFWPMMLAITIGTVAALPLMVRADPRLASALLGVALLGYAVFTLFAAPRTIPVRAERAASPVVGLVTGVVTGATGVFVIPAVPYLQALGLKKDELVQALGLSFTVSTLAMAAGLAGQGAFEPSGLLRSCLLVVPALAGMWLGQRFRGRISQKAFRRGFLIVLALLGLQMIGTAIVSA